MNFKGRAGRIISGSQAKAVHVVAILMSIFHLYFLGIGVIDPWLYRGGHLAFGLVIIFLITPATKKSAKDKFTMLDIILAALSVMVYIYLIINLKGLNMRAGVSPTTADIIVAAVTIVLVIEASRRYFGLMLPAIAIIFMLYAYFGRYIPGDFMVPAYSIKRIASYLFSTTGMYGITIATSATYVFLFVLFGVFLVETGVGDVFMDIAKSITGGVRGGPAKIAVVSSAFFGSVSGSASSNVVTTGAFTIPLMKKTGYKGTFAAAVETTASIGGLFLPPIMGAGGFLMADILQIPYWQVAKAAACPAILYYIALFILVDFEAVSLNLKGLPREQLPKLGKVMKERGYLLIPIAVMLYLLIIARTSPIKSAIWAIISSIIVSWFKKDTRVDLKKLCHILSEGARQSLNVVATTACAGIIVGVVQMTGVGLTISSILLSIGGATMLGALITSMVIAIILGMGLPITATYITVSAILAPALIDLGIEPIAAHLFLYFFAAVSGMTPPVCVTAFAAAGLANEDPMKVGYTSVKLGWAAYVLPYMFVYGKALILLGTAGEIISSIITALVGCVAIASALHGILSRKLSTIERVVLGLGGLLLIDVGAFTNYIGFTILIGFAVFYFISGKKSKSLKA